MAAQDSNDSAGIIKNVEMKQHCETKAQVQDSKEFAVLPYACVQE